MACVDKELTSALLNGKVSDAESNLRNHRALYAVKQLVENYANEY